MNATIKTPEHALVTALVLALTAPTSEKAKECSDIAESIAAGLDHETVELAKAQALEFLDA